jgi:hypothetical protein
MNKVKNKNNTIPVIINTVIKKTFAILVKAIILMISCILQHLFLLLQKVQEFSDRKTYQKYPATP